MRSMTQKKKIKSEDVQKPPGHSLAASSWLLSCVEYHQRDHLRTNCPGGRREKNLFHSLPSIKASFTEPQSFQAESLGSLGSSPGSQWPQGSLMTVQAQWSSLPCNGLQRQWWPGSISVEIVWGQPGQSQAITQVEYRKAGGTWTVSNIAPALNPWDHLWTWIWSLVRCYLASMYCTYRHLHRGRALFSKTAMPRYARQKSGWQAIHTNHPSTDEGRNPFSEIILLPPDPIEGKGFFLSVLIEKLYFLTSCSGRYFRRLLNNFSWSWSSLQRTCIQRNDTRAGLLVRDDLLEFHPLCRHMILPASYLGQSQFFNCTIRNSLVWKKENLTWCLKTRVSPEPTPYSLGIVIKFPKLSGQFSICF